MIRRLDIERWFLETALKKCVCQGDQLNSLTNLFVMLREVVAREYTEDNQETQEAFLQACFERSRSFYQKVV